MAKKKPTTTYESLVEQAKALRHAYERSEAEFLLGLHEIERRHMEILRLNGCDVFARFLNTHKLCRPARYAQFVEGLQHVEGPEAAIELGAPAVMALAGVRDVAKVPEYREAVLAWRADHAGVAPTEQTARTLLRQVDPRKEVPKAVRRRSAMDELRAENHALRKEVAELRKENAALKQRLSGEAA